MIFYVRKNLTSGMIRFGVGERAASVPSPDSENPFSTGPAGEYRRRSPEALYFAEERTPGTPASSPGGPPASGRPSSLTLASKILIAVGSLILLLGILLLARKGDPIAWIEILLGLGMILTPIIRTAKVRRDLRLQAERERAEREERERRNRELVGAFAAALEAMRREPGPASIERVRQARSSSEIPYDAVAPLARETVIQVGFDALSRFPKINADEVGRVVEEAGEAVGLNEADRQAVKQHLVQKLLWHLLADDLLSDGHGVSLQTLRRALRLGEEAMPAERDAAAQFGHLRGLRVENLPKVDAPITLRFQEVCHHRSRGDLLKKTRRGWISMGDRYLTVTSRRVVLSNGKEREIRLEEVFNLEVDADARSLTIETADQESIVLNLPDPIYTAAIIAIATKTPRKPKGLA